MIVVVWDTDHVELTQDSLSPSPVLSFSPTEWQQILDAQASGAFPDSSLPLQIDPQGSGWNMFRLDDPSVFFYVPRRPDMAVFITNMQAGDYALDKLNPPTP